MMKKICAVSWPCCVVLSGDAGIAQTSRHVAVHAGHLLDVKTGKLLADQTLVIEDGKIVSTGAAAEAKIPADAVRIELPNATVLPGLIDAHTHLTMEPKFGYERLAISVPREALIGAKNARVTLLAGFTTVRNVGARGYTDVALRDAINAGDVPGPRMLVSGPPLSITGGHCDNNLLPFEYHATERWRGRRHRGGATQGSREHQVRRGSDQGVRNRRRAFAGRQSAGLAVHAGRDEGDCGRRAPPGTQSRRACARSAGHSLGVGGGSRFDRARLLH